MADRFFCIPTNFQQTILKQKKKTWLMNLLYLRHGISHISIYFYKNH
jgi:hypothetical protein